VSKLRERLTKMAEPTAVWQEMQQEKRDSMQLSDSAVCKDFPDSKYKNQKGMVSPLNIIVMDYANSIYSMPFDEAISFVIDNIQALNSKYEGDPFYDTFSEKSGGYLRKLEYKLKTMKKRTPDALIEYLTNAMYKGMTAIAAVGDEDNDESIIEKGLVKHSETNIDKTKYLKLVNDLKEAMFNLGEAWEGEKGEDYAEVNTFLSYGYPFQEGFDKVVSRVIDWYDILEDK
jgi:hypothetical protein